MYACDNSYWYVFGPMIGSIWALSLVTYFAVRRLRR